MQAEADRGSGPHALYRSMLWGVIVLWLLCCAASLSLPWPGIVLVILLSCVAFFEFANPNSRVGSTGTAGGAKEGGAATTSGGVDVMPRGRRRSPSAALSYAFNILTERLWGGGCDDEMGELRTTERGASGASRRLAAKANTKVSDCTLVYPGSSSLPCCSLRIRLQC